MERFTPSTSGFITSNKQMEAGSETIDININREDSEPIQLQGTRQNVDSLTRFLSDRMRYAS